MKKIFLVCVLMLLSLVFAMAACGKEKEETPPPPDPEESILVTVSGTVTDENSAPLSGVVVRAVDGMDIAFDPVTTGDDGKFAIEKVSKQRELNLTFEKDGFYTVSKKLTLSDFLFGRNEIGEVAMSAYSNMMTFGSKVVALDGKTPVNGVNVSVEGFTQTATTSSDGKFTFTDFPVGEGQEFTFVLSKDGWGESKYTFTSQEISDGIESIAFGLNAPVVKGGINYAVSVTRDDNGVTVLAQLEGSLISSKNSFRVQMRNDDTGDLYEAYLWDDEATYVGEVEGAYKFFKNGGNITGAAGCTYEYDTEGEKGSFMKLFVPYETLGITAEDAFGFAVISVQEVATDYWYALQVASFEDENTSDPVYLPPAHYYMTVDENGQLSAREQQTATVSGTVKQKDSAVEGAEVILKNNKNEVIGTMVTGADGKFSFNGIAVQTGLKVSAAKESVASDEIFISYAELYTGTVEKSLTLPEIVETREIEGVVYMLDGKTPLKDCTVSVKGLDISGVTDAEGRFVLSDVPINENGVTLLVEADECGIVEKKISKAEIDEGNIAIKTGTLLAGENGMLDYRFQFVREETGIHVYLATTKSLFWTTQSDLRVQLKEFARGSYLEAFVWDGNGYGDYPGGIAVFRRGSNEMGGTAGLVNEGYVYQYEKNPDGSASFDLFVEYTAIGVAAGDDIGVAIVGVLADSAGAFGVKSYSSYYTDAVAQADAFTPPAHYYVLCDANGNLTPQTESFVSISGKVMQGDLPVSGAQVFLKDANGNVLSQTVTDESGAYFFADVVVEKDLIIYAETEGISCAENIRLKYGEMKENDVFADKDLIIPQTFPKYDVTGTVTQLDGTTGLEGVTVSIKGTALSTITDGEGKFSFMQYEMKGNELVLLIEKEGCGLLEKTIGVEEVAGGNILLRTGDVVTGENGSLDYRYQFVREETGIRVYIDTTRTLLVPGTRSDLRIRFLEEINNSYVEAFLWDGEALGYTNGIAVFRRGTNSTGGADGNVTEGFTYQYETAADGSVSMNFFVEYAVLGITKDDSCGVSIIGVLLDQEGGYVNRAFCSDESLLTNADANYPAHFYVTLDKDGVLTKRTAEN